MNNLGKSLAIVVSITGWMVFAAPAQATMYIYQLPDGSRIISDHALKGSQYSLVRSSRKVKGMGMLAASNNHQLFRAKTSNYDSLIKETGFLYRVDPALIKAVVHAESAFNPLATSSKGASGLMQIMPKTAEIYGVTDIYDPEQNLRAGAQYLRHLLARYNNKPHLALAAYNAGPRAVSRYRGVPPYRETRNYIKKVLKFKRRYASLTL